jgi:hypothetical protein
MARFNPFRPDGIVAPGMFAGRVEELLAVEGALDQTKLGNSKHFLIQGERGIGKSSLMYYVQVLATGQIPVLGSAGERFNFLTLPIELETSTAYEDIIGRVALSLRNELKEHQLTTEAAKKLWDFAKKWEAFGFKYNAAENATRERYQLLEELVSQLVNIATNIEFGFDGILILIDEADKAPPTAHLGEFVKLLTEKLTKQECHNVCVGLAGQPSLLDKLRKSHESSVRVFQILTLDPLAPEDREHVIHLGLAQAAEKNGVETTIEKNALGLLAQMSEGYPHFLQEYAYYAFAADNDGNINFGDADLMAFFGPIATGK